jgi:hypothetical protein
MLKLQEATVLKVRNTAHFHTVPTSKKRVNVNIKHLVQI